MNDDWYEKGMQSDACFPDDCTNSIKCLKHAKCFCGDTGYWFELKPGGDFANPDDLVQVPCEMCNAENKT